MICLIAGALSGEGYDVHLISLDHPNAVSFYEMDAKITWHRLGSRKDAVGKAQRIARMAAILRRFDVGVLIGFVISGDKTVYAASRIAGVKLVAAERNGPSMYRLRFGPVARWQCFVLLHLCDSIVVQFPEYIRGYPRSLRERMVCIPNPVASDVRHAAPETPRSNGRFQLLAVSRLDRIQKGLDVLIGAFAQIADEHPRWDLKIVGTGPHETDLRKLISDLDLSDRIIIEVPKEQVQDLYAKAHLFVIPSRWEGFPNALAEALSAGLPAAGFAGSEGVANLISHGRTGWLVDSSNDVAAMAAILAEAMLDGAERGRRGALAVEEMKNYAPEAQIELWADLAQRLGNEKG